MAWWVIPDCSFFELFYGVGLLTPCQPPTWRTRPPNLCPPETGWPSCTPRHWVSLLVTSYDTKGYGGVILLRPHTETWCKTQDICCYFMRLINEIELFLFQIYLFITLIKAYVLRTDLFYHLAKISKLYLLSLPAISNPLNGYVYVGRLDKFKAQTETWRPP
jgi:hypothetical protein